MTPARLLDRVLGRLTASGRKLVPLAYVNTSLSVKAVVGRYGGAVCTSANAEKMMNWSGYWKKNFNKYRNSTRPFVRNISEVPR